VSRDAGAGEATRIVAVRHGETVWNAEMRMQGQLDTALSERGRRQAARAAQALAGEGIEAIVASDLVRAYDTAATIAAVLGLPIKTDTGLRERSFGIFQGHTYAEIDARWPADAARWRHHDPAFAPEGGESLVAFSARAVAAVTRIAERARGTTILVVSHGGVLDCLYRAASGLDLAAPRSWELGNASINRLLFTGERFTLVGAPRRRPARRRQRRRLPDRAASGDMNAVASPNSACRAPR
jgi:probable phosphoglycerate mutase